MRRLLYIVILLMTATNIIAQDFKVRECTEAELPRSKRDRYFVQVTQFLNNYYMHLLNLEDNIMHENFVGLVYSDKNAATLIPEFSREVLPSSRMKPGQYLMELEKSLRGLDKNGLEFVVDKVSPGKIMMNSLVSCYIPVEYDLTLMEGDKTLFKRRCRMYGLFDDIRNYMDVKLMQVEPVKTLVSFTVKPDKKTDDVKDGDDKVDSQQAKVMPATKNYDFINPASEGLAMVRLGQLHGYIDSDGNEVIPLMYQTGYPFWAGLAAVRYGGSWGFINTNNQIVLPFVYETYVDARKQISKLANNGNTSAQLLMGYWHYYGREDYKQSFKTSLLWFRLAAEGGRTEAAYYLAFQYENAQGTDKDINQALYWYGKAKGYADADARYKQLQQLSTDILYQPKQVKEKTTKVYYAIDNDLGASLSAIDKRTQKKLKLPGGVKITSVRDGRLKESGCRNEFIITRANKMEVVDIRALQHIITHTKQSGGKTLLLEGIYSTGDKAAYAIDLK